MFKKFIPYLLWSNSQRQYPILAIIWLGVPLAALESLYFYFNGDTTYEWKFVLAMVATIALTLLSDALADEIDKRRPQG